MWPDLLSAAVSGSFVIVSMMYQSRRHRPRSVTQWAMILLITHPAGLLRGFHLIESRFLWSWSIRPNKLYWNCVDDYTWRMAMYQSRLIRKSEGLRLMIINQRWWSSTTTSSPNDGAAWLAISRLAPYAAHDLRLLIICSLLLLIREAILQEKCSFF